MDDSDRRPPPASLHFQYLHRALRDYLLLLLFSDHITVQQVGADPEIVQGVGGPTDKTNQAFISHL